MVKPVEKEVGSAAGTDGWRTVTMRSLEDPAGGWRPGGYKEMSSILADQ